MLRISVTIGSFQDLHIYENIKLGSGILRILCFYLQIYSGTAYRIYRICYYMESVKLHKA